RGPPGGDGAQPAGVVGGRTAQQAGAVGVPVRQRVDAGVDAAEDHGAVVDGGRHLERVDRPGLAREEDPRQLAGVGGQAEGPGEVVAAAGGHQAERGAGAAEGTADAPGDAVPADGEHHPALFPGGAGQFARVGEAAAVLGPQVGARLPEQPRQGDQRGGAGRAARGGVDDGGELAHRAASGGPRGGVGGAGSGGVPLTHRRAGAGGGGGGGARGGGGRGGGRGAWGGRGGAGGGGGRGGVRRGAAHSPAGRSTPGLSSPAGSRCRFTASSACAATGPISRRYQSRWSVPTPWWWLMVPPAARIASLAACLARVQCATASSPCAETTVK